MVVRVIGRDGSGELHERVWQLLVEDGDGPMIPAVPAEITVHKLAKQEVAKGARAALGVFSFEEAEAALGRLHVSTHQVSARFKCLFPDILGPEFLSLPSPLQALHEVVEQRDWTGQACVTRGTGIFAKIAAGLAGFPPAAEAVPVTVMMQRIGDKERWVRTFGDRVFRSYLSKGHRDGQHVIRERFGAMVFEVPLVVAEDALHFPVSRGWCFGVPLPRFLLPKSDTREFVDAYGRACFDVSISLPIAGFVIRYQGWLTPAHLDPSGEVRDA